jgi:Yip1-like protein
MSSPTSSTPPPPTPNPSATPAAPPEPVGPGLSEPQRLLDVFIAPSKTFADVKRNASWWVPWLLLTLVGASYQFTIGKKIGWEPIIQARMAHATPFFQRALDQMTPEQKQNMIEKQVNGSQRGIYYGPVFVMLYGLIAAGVLTPTFNFALDAGVKFKHALAVVFYGALPRILWTGLGMVAIYAGVEADGFDYENPVATSLGTFLGINSDSRFLYRLLSGFDVFFIWIVIVIGLGFAQIASRKISKGSAIAIVAGWYMVMILCRAVLASVVG